MFTIKGVRFKIGPSSHDNTLPTGADGGPTAAFFVTFENGFTIFYNGHSTLVAICRHTPNSTSPTWRSSASRRIRRNSPPWRA